LKPFLVSPSLLSADQLNLERAVREVEASGADALHIDVMDGHFVPNLTFGLPLIASLKKITKLPLDVHIMVSNPDHVASHYVQAGADSLCFHIEASVHPYRTLQMIRKSGVKSGIALNPGTSITVLESLCSELDMILLLSVNPGFSGQDFLPVVYSKLKTIQNWKAKKILAKNATIAVDGGVGDQNIKKLVKFGANFFITGSYFFNASNKKLAVSRLYKSV
jgi:ribulose-phosphate 3-epimerase